jgi:hypothetical protein
MELQLTDAATTKSDLFSFIHAVDETFPVVPTRISSLSVANKLDFGVMLLTNALHVFWLDRAQSDSEDFQRFLIDWVTSFGEALVSDILVSAPSDAVALKQVLVLNLPPHIDSEPQLPLTDGLITRLSSIRAYSDAFERELSVFLESRVCLAPLPVVVLIRDCVVLMILLSSRERRIYTARTREVLFRVCKQIGLDPDCIRIWERSIGEILHGSEHLSNSQANISPDSERRHQAKIALGAIGGGVLLAVTGGLAFPIIASVVAGVGAAFTGIGLGIVGTVFAATSMVLGSISVAGAAALFGITGGSLVSYKLSKRFGSLDVKDFKFKEIKRKSNEDDHAKDALEVVLCISGYLRNSTDYIEPWRIIRETNGGISDPYALQWERKNLLSLSNVFVKLMSSELASAVTSVYLQASLGAVASTVALPVSILTIMSDLDNILIVCENRAKQAGQALAEAIMNPDNGVRPYTLIAYSVGATAAFACLECLEEAGYYSAIQDVIIMGSTLPCTFLYESQRSSWEKARSVVSGRFINVYSKRDMLLQVLCRYLQWTIHAAGITHVNQPGIINFDASHIISKHSDYPEKVGEILRQIQYLH